MVVCGVGIVWVVWVVAKCDFSAPGWLPPRAYPFPFLFLKNLSGGGAAAADDADDADDDDDGDDVDGFAEGV